MNFVHEEKIITDVVCFFLKLCLIKIHFFSSFNFFSFIFERQQYLFNVGIGIPIYIIYDLCYNECYIHLEMISGLIGMKCHMYKCIIEQMSIFIVTSFHIIVFLIAIQNSLILVWILSCFAIDSTSFHPQIKQCKFVNNWMWWWEYFQAKSFKWGK